MGAQASGDVEPVRWHALTTDRDGAPQRVKGVRGNPPLAGTYADLCACCCSREKIHHCTVCKETRPAFLMAMAPAPNQGQVATVEHVLGVVDFGVERRCRQAAAPSENKA